MQSKAKTVEEYIAELPNDRKEAILTVRAMLLENIDKNIEEGMTYGMIGYYIPHRIFPAGYHCDPKQPLPYAGLASQKNHISIYLMSMYENSAEENWLKAEWKKTGKKLDMGKCCIRFKRLDDIPLDLIGEAIRRLPSNSYIERYTKALASRPGKAASKAGEKKTSESGKSNKEKDSKKTASGKSAALKKATSKTDLKKVASGKDTKNKDSASNKTASKKSPKVASPKKTAVKQNAVKKSAPKKTPTVKTQSAKSRKK